MTPVELTRDGYVFSSDPARLQVPVIHAFLTNSPWAREIPEETVRLSLEHSLCFGVYAPTTFRQVGFARVITDRATFAYLSDVFVLEEHRGRGLAERLLGLVRAHPDLQGLRRFLLATRDAHPLYAKLGFSRVERPDIWMEIARPDIYRERTEAQTS